MSLTKIKLKINLFGELWTLKEVVLNSIEKEYYSNIATRLKLTLHEALLDPFFYHHLKLTSVTSLDKLSCKEVSGLMNTQKNQIEIWVEGRKIRVLRLEDFNLDQYLFPLYNTKKSILGNQYKTGIYIEQKEIGFIGSYEFKIENFNLENLQFGLIEHNNQLLLQNISYLNCNTVFKKKQTLINYQHSFEII